MSKTRKRVLSVLAILFAAALVFTACLALTGCGDSEEEGGTESTGTTWPVDWKEYKFDGTANGEEGSYLLLESDGTFWFGDDTLYAVKEYGAGTNGWWGYINSTDTTPTFVKKNGSKNDSNNNCDYSACEMATSGSSVTIGFLNGSGDSCVVTIDDIGCLAGKTGYDFASLEDWDADNNLYQYTEILTA